MHSIPLLSPTTENLNIMTDLKLETFEEQIFFNTVLIENKTDGEFGTGFLMAKDIGNDRIKVLLYSNKHVFWGKKDQDKDAIKKDIEITLHQANEDGTYTLGKVKRFSFVLDRVNKVHYNESKELDVAAIDISDFHNLPDFKSKMILLEFEKFCKNDYSSIICGQEILFVGYPTGFYDRKNFLPIMRKGFISSIPVVDFDGKKQILVDAEVYPGSSGSPVFTVVNGNYQLLGIMSQAVYKGLNFIPVITQTAEEDKTTQLPIEWIGIGILIKNDALIEVCDLF